jgi:hypothetical protein
MADIGITGMEEGLFKRSSDESAISGQFREPRGTRRIGPSSFQT